MPSSKRPMSTIYPKRIKSILRNESPVISFGQFGDITPIDTDTGEIYTDGDNSYPIFKDSKGIKYIKRNGTKVDIRIFDRKIGLLKRCPKCKEKIKGKISEKMYNIRGICHTCVVKDEHKIRIRGQWNEYQDLIILRNKFGFLEDAKHEFEYYINGGLNKNIEYSSDGEYVEKWKNEAFNETMIFLKNELILIESNMLEIKEKILKLENILEWHKEAI